jgi:hypothetical protein
MATEDDLIGMVLDEYRATPGSGQAYNADDINKVRPYIAPVVEDLNQRLGVYFADTDDIPAAQAVWLAVAIAHAARPLASFYGVTPDAEAQRYAENMLSAQVQEPITEPVKFTDY